MPTGSAPNPFDSLGNLIECAHLGMAAEMLQSCEVFPKRKSLTPNSKFPGFWRLDTPCYDRVMEPSSDNDNSITPFAITNYRDIRQRFGIKEKNRRGHMYLVGKSGTGKSTLISNLASHDLQSGYGLALIDPHGDLAEEILDAVPAARINDVIYLNPADLEFPVAFNPLAS